MNSQGLNFNLTIFNCLIAVTILELLSILRRSHYSGISISRGYNFPVILHFKGLIRISMEEPHEKFDFQSAVHAWEQKKKNRRIKFIEEILFYKFFQSIFFTSNCSTYQHMK